MTSTKLRIIGLLLISVGILALFFFFAMGRGTH